MRTKAERRHNKARVGKRRRALLLQQHWGEDYANSRWGSSRLETFTKCSCETCGNPRHYGKKTLQEIKSPIEWE